MQTSCSLNRRRRGAVLVLSMIFVVVFSALAISLASMSGTNVQIAENHHKLEGARACAESGLEIIRYCMNRTSLSGTTAPEARFTALAASLQEVAADPNIPNISPVYNGSTIAIANIPIDADLGLTFSALMTSIDSNTVQVDVTGHFGQVSRTIRTNYVFGTRAHSVFDFGVASKGPVSLSGNIELEGVTIDVESNAYIESANTLLALSIIGNSHIAGQVKIVNPRAYVDLHGGKAGIGGVTGEEATKEPYTTIGAPAADFPEMVPSQFASLVTLTEMDPNTNTSADVVLENIIIPANLSPTFSGHATLKGLIWVETPNVVTFTGGADVTAIIVGNGDPDDNSATNILDFKGNVDGAEVATLPGTETQFDGLRDSTGTFIIAPGFHVSFGGSFDALCGAIAANGVEFYGNAGGEIKGSIINYSEKEMTLSGNSDLHFNRSGLDDLPAGFVPEIVMLYDPASYAEVNI